MSRKYELTVSGAKVKHENALRTTIRNLQRERETFKILFAEWHKTKRKELGYTQKELSQRMLIHWETIRKYEQAKALPLYLDDYIHQLNQLKGKARK
jgi:ribosome-binding protein aMBF1 (putative translation factor)